MDIHHVPRFSTVLAVAVVIRVALIVYSEWHDAHSNVKYTDVDYRVFTDASTFLLHSGPGQLNHAQGPLTQFLNLTSYLGDPYTRDTYRYTPLLALLMAPNEWFPAFGKYVFAFCDIACGLLLHKMLTTHIFASVAADEKQQQTSSSWATFYSLLYLLNPLVFSISTRGSSESILSLAVLATLDAALYGQWDKAAILLGFCTHWKLYPFVYGIACVVSINAAPGKTFSSVFVNPTVWRFASLSAGTFFALGGGCYAIWGQPFLEHTYIYHIHRLDHRHNFSPYFYLTYLTYPGTTSFEILPAYFKVLGSSLISFFPQLVLSISGGLLSVNGTLEFAWFVQTAVFVLFNKVCTSQYFLWYLHFVPLLAPNLNLTRRSGIILFVGWFASQGLWLAEAYRLEFLGDPVFKSLWARSLIYFVSHCVVLVLVLRSYQGRRRDTRREKQGKIARAQ